MEGTSLRFAVEGCCHGELDRIYETINCRLHEGQRIDCLLICGDFECVRNTADLECMAVPPKYRKLNTFQDYISGRKIAPVLTIFVGGNHEASNILQNLYYGGWVAPNIFFLGYASVIRINGVRIGGVSGIQNWKHYHCGHYEKYPYSQDDLRSIYHIRELEIYRMNMLRRRDEDSDLVKVLLSHDWPKSIWNYGNLQRLLTRKPYLEGDMQSGKLGSEPLFQILLDIKPMYWFAAHHHVRFEGTVYHSAVQSEDSNEINLSDGNSSVNNCCCKPCSVTHFIALDKVKTSRDRHRGRKIPRMDQPMDDSSINENDCLHYFSVPSKHDYCGVHLAYDLEWLAILKLTRPMERKDHRKEVLGQPPEISKKLVDEAMESMVKRDLVIPSFEYFYPPAARSVATLLQDPYFGCEQTEYLLNIINASQVTSSSGHDSACDPNELCVDDI